jgi:antitoxin VapB
MALSIKNPEAEALAAEVTRRTGETMTRAVVVALRERLERLTGRRDAPSRARVLLDISRRCSALPDLDTRTDDEILGYGPHGTFGD